ncbi:hypothetical protein [Desulfocurvibacter africanus]|uniref:DUF4875 domain-containing protein n=1 Tax=Desulfocurvibacter africanus TaxID=873 RepID=UPI00048690D5|nr:hypothetical protein [Desulfocurvibacter africanus]
MKVAKSLCIALAFSFIFSANGFAEKVAFSITGKEDFSFPGRSRKSFTLVPDRDDLTFDMLLEAVKSAAVNLQQNERCDVVEVWITCAKSGDTFSGFNVLALARYCPDGRGHSGSDKWTWEVFVTKNATPDKIKFINALETRYPKFRDMYSKEYNAARTQIAADLGLPPDFRPDIELEEVVSRRSGGV